MEKVEEGLYEVRVTDTNLGLYSQWSWTPRNGIDDIWGTIKPLSIPWGNNLRAKNCECPFDESKCPEQVCEVGLFSGPYGSIYWRKVENQIVSKLDVFLIFCQVLTLQHKYMLLSNWINF